MSAYRQLWVEGALLNKQELYSYLEKLAASHTICQKSSKNTYPIPRMMDNFNAIKEVYNILNENVKNKVQIHPAGEWLLDNFYAIEEVVKSIEKEMTLKKYKKFVGLSKGKYQGFARIYVLASQIVNYTENKINREVLEESLKAYQTKKNLSMDEIWNIGIFMQIAIIENIRQIAENIYISQYEKIRVESIIERLVERKPKKERKYNTYKGSKNIKIKMYDIKYPFVEYLSYKLKKYGKKTENFLNILEEEVEKTGTSVSEITKREHFEIAINKISIGNAITSIKKLQRINFLEIFEKINKVEEILKLDPAKVYDKMDFKTKENYRNAIKEISKKTKISEMYISKKILELATNAYEKNDKSKKSHIGYYLQNENMNILLEKLQCKEQKKFSESKKVKLYISTIFLFTIIISAVFANYYPQSNQKMWIKVITFFILLIPISEIVIQVIQYILSKIVKPKTIPKLNFENGIPENESTFVIIPTIVDSKEKVKQMLKNLEIDYLANKSQNLYFCLLGDCKQSDKEIEDYDVDVIRAGIEETERLNKKYTNLKFPIFHFIYRKRKWNESENAYLGWERKRGAITDFTDFLLNNLSENDIQEKFEINTISELKKQIPKIKYIITLDADTDLTLNSAYELVGTMAHILNKPEVENGKIVSGYGLIQPRVGINLDITYKSWFTKIFAGMGGIDSYANAISDTYQDNFGEGIFTGKGIFNLKMYSKILKNEIPENTVLSHDLLEGNYLRCGLATDVLIMDGYPTKFSSFITRLSRWIRGDWQILKWLKNKKLNLLSKFKIFDNLRRSMLEISEAFAIIYFTVIGKIYNISIICPLIVLVLTIVFPYLLEILNNIIFKREGEQTQKTFTPKLDGYIGAICRGIITFLVFPFKMWISLKAITKTLYRLIISKKHLLEWMTSEEAEKNSKDDILNYYKMMLFNVISGIITILFLKNTFGVIAGISWVISPLIMWVISKEIRKTKPKDKLNKNEIIYVTDVAKRTFNYFYDNLNEQNNYLIPDNYQEDRKKLYVDRTSSTNIGLSIMAIMAGYDLKFISLEETNSIFSKIIDTVWNLKKWNGHLYNWYNIKTLEPLIPEYISTVDSGNFIGYLYVLKAFLENQKNEELQELILKVNNLIDNTDFSKLYSNEHRLFSIGFNVQDRKTYRFLL